MASRRNRHDFTPADAIELMTRFPAWVGPLLIAVVFVAMRWLIPWCLVDEHLKETLSSRPPSGMFWPVYFGAAGSASQFLAPYAAALIGGLWVAAEAMKWWSRRRLQPAGDRTIPAGHGAQSAGPVGLKPACPLCNSEMVLRTAGKGPNKGSQFWGCSGYPSCKGTRPAGSSVASRQRQT